MRISTSTFSSSGQLTNNIEINALLYDCHRGDFAAIETAETLFGVPPAKENNTSCSPLVIRISHLQSIEKDIQRPQVFVSGEIHGDERIVSICFFLSLLTRSLYTH